MLRIYHASAGSGKTYQLTYDYILTLLKSENPNSHRNILAVTFTNKATSEMKSRIIEELNALANGHKSPYRNDLMQACNLNEQQLNTKAGNLLIRILHDYPAFSVSTIDKFFQLIIRSFARDIGVNGSYSLELNKDDILQQAVDNLFADLSEKSDKQLLDWLMRFAEEKIEQSENWDLRRPILSLGEEIFRESFQHKAEDTNKMLHNKDFLKNYIGDLSIIIGGFDQRMNQLADNCLQIIDNHGLNLQDFKNGNKSPVFNLTRKIKKQQYDVSATFLRMIDDEGECYSKSTPSNTKGAIIRAYHGGLQENLKLIKEMLEKEIVRYYTARFIRKHLNTMGILTDLAIQIRKLTTEQNIMLINDSNLLLNKIIDKSDSPFIYEKTGSFIRHFMIDEFQDTSQLQWQNFLPLIQNSMSADNFNLVVGDVKQSIYRWRNSDWKLLESGIYQDFDSESIEDKTLDTNWRSDSNIVGFNNAIFEVAAAGLQQKLNAGLDEIPGSNPATDMLRSKIVNAYSDLKQLVSPGKGEGRVQYNFIDAEDADEGEKWKDMALKALPSLLEDFQERGYKPSDVCMLVRANRDVPIIVNKLLSYKSSEEARPGFSYDIMGTEGLLPVTSPAVRFMLGIMQLFIYPDDKTTRIIVAYEYARGCLHLPEDEALSRVLSAPENENTLCVLFTDEENEALNKLKYSPLFEMTEKIIRIFRLANWNSDFLFLQAFQDMVFKFSSGKTSDLNNFLQWWERTGARQSISIPDNENAFRIMTIHKSKGLDFKAVIIPFCDWKLDSKSNDILWCTTTVKPFCELPLLPVEYNKLLSKTIFANEYFMEKMQYYIDNLNMAYVAFTRARHELICFSPKPKPNKDGKVSIGSFGSLAYHCFENAQSNFLSEGFRAEENKFETGQPVHIHYEGEKQENPMIIMRDYPSCEIGTRLKIRHRIGKINREETDVTESPVDYGNLMHELLCEVNRPEDDQPVIERFIREGRINSREAAIIEADMRAFRQMPETAEWFGDGLQIMNETTILAPGGHTYRPDRIILRDNEATIIDYKFGEKESNAHRRQVENYRSLMHQMGYQTRAFLCYVKLRKVVQL
jgi:ATP-dependent helicase/nuclease subunit A